MDLVHQWPSVAFAAWHCWTAWSCFVIYTAPATFFLWLLIYGPSSFIVISVAVTSYYTVCLLATKIENELRKKSEIKKKKTEKKKTLHLHWKSLHLHFCHRSVDSPSRYGFSREWKTCKTPLTLSQKTGLNGFTWLRVALPGVMQNQQMTCLDVMWLISISAFSKVWILDYTRAWVVVYIIRKCYSHVIFTSSKIYFVWYK